MKIKYIFTEVNRTVAVKCCMSWYLQELNKNGNIMVGQNKQERLYLVYKRIQTLIN